MVAEGARRSTFPTTDLPNSGDDTVIDEAPMTMSQSSSPMKFFAVDQLKVNEAEETDKTREFPILRSGSFATIGGRLRMEDAHILVHDLSTYMAATAKAPTPISLYGVYDGHGGPGAAAYVRNNIPRLLLEDPNFPQSYEVDKSFLKEIGDSMNRAYFTTDQALADRADIGHHTGTTALTAVIAGRHLIVANTGDCRAVLCRKGEAVNLSLDHRPIYPSERKRVEELGGFVTHEGYLDGVLSLSRALGDWDMKRRPPGAAPSPLISDPDIVHCELAQDDEFLIMACDGVWDVMTSQCAVSYARRAMNKNDSPERCARDLVMRALDMGSLDNLTVVVVCFTAQKQRSPKLSDSRRIWWSKFGLSSTALCSFRGLV